MGWKTQPLSTRPFTKSLPITFRKIFIAPLTSALSNLPILDWYNPRFFDKKDGIISQKRIDQLDSLGMVWSIDEETFDTMIHRLVIYKKIMAIRLFHSVI